MRQIFGGIKHQQFSFEVQLCDLVAWALNQQDIAGAQHDIDKILPGRGERSATAMQGQGDSLVTVDETCAAQGVPDQRGAEEHRYFGGC